MSSPEAQPSAEHVRRDFLWLGCYSGNHHWQIIGGCNASCGRWCTCSVPVHECQKCGDCDYGHNAEADDIRQRCTDERAL